MSEHTSAARRGRGRGAARDPDEPSADDQVEGDDHSSTAKKRFEGVSQPIRDRLEQPIGRVSTITKKTMELFPVRVWRQFLSRNGFILSAGMSYQALFAIFAAVYVVFAVAGLWLTGNPARLEAFSTLLNTYAPGFIGSNGVISTEDLTEIATTSTSLFGWTGAVALAGLIWTAIGWITYARTAVRSIFGLPKDTRAYLLLKARDFLAGLAFGTVLLIASALSVATTSFLGWVFGLLGIPTSTASAGLFGGGALILVFCIDTLALAVMFRFLSGATMPWRRMWIGSLLGSAALSVLQILGSFLITGATRNPLLASFAVIIGLLIWFNLVCQVILIGASWIAVGMADRGLAPDPAMAAAERERVRVERERIQAEARGETGAALVALVGASARSGSWRGFGAGSGFGCRFNFGCRLAGCRGTGAARP